jgi:3-carboxy-cis,cis-muconate cycloisomerase
MADRLGLAVAPMPWHAQRDGLVAVGAWMASVAAALGKMAGDIALMCRSEQGEARLAGAGGSSTMPNKANPTRAEAVVALARLVPHHQAALQGAQVHGEERDGAAWLVEWAALPALTLATGAALRHGLALLGSLEIVEEGLDRRIADSRGLILAEAAAFALAGHMDKAAAQALVKRACAETVASGRPLPDVLSTLTDAPIDWSAVADAGRHVGNADALIDRVLATHRALTEGTDP